MNVVLGPGVLDAVVAHVQSSLPSEGCGLIAGSNGVGTRFIPMTNILASERAYEMDPGELISTLRSLRLSGEEIVVIVHSHPSGPASPSARDIERAYYPESAQLIVSLADPQHPRFRAFRIAAGAASEVELRVIV